MGASQSVADHRFKRVASNEERAPCGMCSLDVEAGEVAYRCRDVGCTFVLHDVRLLPPPQGDEALRALVLRPPPHALRQAPGSAGPPVRHLRRALQRRRLRLRLQTVQRLLRAPALLRPPADGAQHSSHAARAHAARSAAGRNGWPPPHVPQHQRKLQQRQGQAQQQQRRRLVVPVRPMHSRALPQVPTAQRRRRPRRAPARLLRRPRPRNHGGGGAAAGNYDGNLTPRVWLRMHWNSNAAARAAAGGLLIIIISRRRRFYLHLMSIQKICLVLFNLSMGESNYYHNQDYDASASAANQSTY
ncbi:hypothetical protein GQ55_6G269800 [Panicum hallii var. hallii]|uniref:Uncharacterized protein n=1 Tax=Panicum hallii var. hallii TaxID=1504633 RepID=A0A2T7DA26_9POAL|nr:hypothetical protein GQ55_6G269800 [Panicum hallii var. hallii]